MNYVAHLYLTHPDQDLSIGNLLGDLLANKLVEELSPVFRHGVTIHRFIDSFTDSHKSLDEARRVLRVRHRKYAPVVLDLLLDYVLVDEWQAYADGTFDAFQGWVYDSISRRSHLIPQSAGIRLQHMAHGRWLNSYNSIDRFQQVLARMDRRARFDSHFGDAVYDLEEHRDVLSASLAGLMPNLQNRVADLMREFNPQNGGRS